MHVYMNGLPTLPGLRSLEVACRAPAGLSLYEFEQTERAVRILSRGRIDRPTEGWISLENMDSGYRYVRPGLV